MRNYLHCQVSPTLRLRHLILDACVAVCFRCPCVEVSLMITGGGGKSWQQRLCQDIPLLLVFLQDDAPGNKSLHLAYD